MYLLIFIRIKMVRILILMTIIEITGAKMVTAMQMLTTMKFEMVANLSPPFLS